MEGEPIVPPPAEHAPHRPHRKHAQQAVERAQFCRFELNRLAARTFVLGPNQIREDRTAVPALPKIVPTHICRFLECQTANL
jgi:hypothetical protein